MTLKDVQLKIIRVVYKWHYCILYFCDCDRVANTCLSTCQTPVGD